MAGKLTDADLRALVAEVVGAVGEDEQDCCELNLMALVYLGGEID